MRCATSTFLLISMLLVTSNAYQSAQAELVAHWPLDEGSGTVFRDIAGGYDGFVPTGAIPVWTADAPPTGFANPYALEFNSADQGYVDTLFEGIGSDTPRTIAAWVKTESTATQGIVGYGDTATGAKYHFVINGDGDPRVPGAPRTESSGGNLTGDMSIADGVWHHVVSVFPSDYSDNEEILHYVDGVLQGATGVTPNFIETIIGDDFPNVTIGARQNAPPAYDSFMNGFIDDVRMYDRALTDSEIQDLIQNPTTDGLVAHWPMDDGPGSTTVTELVAENHGTLRTAISASVEWADDGPEGIQSTSVRFTGDQGPSYIETPFNGIGGNNPRTITLWMKADVQHTNTAMVAYGSLATARKWHFRIDQANNSLRTEYSGGQNFAETPVTDGEWHFVASVFPEGAEMGSEILHFLDGEFDPFGGGADQAIDTATGDEAGAFPVHIGWAVGHADRYFAGQIADVRIYDEELSEEQLIEIMMGNVVGHPGDYNRNGDLDAGDLDLQAVEMQRNPPDLDYDLNRDGRVDIQDRQVWVDELKNTWMGDSNLDGQFNTSDFVQVLSAGKYETGLSAGWAEGDWNGDSFFGTGDLVTALNDGGYEMGLKPGGPNLSAVPEPASWLLALLGISGLLGVCQRRE